MPNIRISDMPPATLPLSGAELVEIVQNSFSRQMTTSDLASLVAGLDATFVTLSPNVGLANERVLTAGTGIALVDTGPGGTVTINGSAAPPAGNLPLGTVEGANLYWDDTGAAWVENTIVRFDVAGTSFEVRNSLDLTSFIKLDWRSEFNPRLDLGANKSGSAADLVYNGQLNTFSSLSSNAILNTLRIHSGMNTTASNIEVGHDVTSGFIFTDNVNGGTLDLRAQNGALNIRFIDGSGLMIEEKAAALADTVAFGQFWVRNDAPNVAMFTDDAGNDFLLSGPSSLFSRVLTDINTATPPVAELVSGVFDIFDAQNVNQLASVGFSADNVLEIRNYFTDNTSSIEFFIANEAFPIGRFRRSTPGNTRGLYVLNDDDGNQDTIIAMTDASGNLRGDWQFIGGTTMALTNRHNGGRVDFEYTAGGGVRRGIRLDANTDNVELYQANAQVANTLAAASGGFEVNNTLTGGGFERVLTTSDAGFSTPIVLLDNEQIQFGTGTDVTQDFDGTNFLTVGVAASVWLISGFDQVRVAGALGINEAAAPDGDVAGVGQFWVRSDAPNTPMFTDDTGVDFVLNLELYLGGTAKIRASDETANDIGMGAEVVDQGGTFRPVGMNVAPPETVNVAMTFGLIDNGQIKIHDEATVRIWTVNQSTDVPIGALYGIININGTGTISLTPGAGVAFEYWDGTNFINSTGVRTLGEGQFTIYKRSDIEYVVNGPNIT